MEGRGGWVFRMVSNHTLPTGLLTFLLHPLSLAVHDHIRDVRDTAPEHSSFNRFPTMTISTSNCQPTTPSTTIYALIRRRCGGREGDHEAEGDDSRTSGWGDDTADSADDEGS